MNAPGASRTIAPTAAGLIIRPCNAMRYARFIAKRSAMKHTIRLRWNFSEQPRAR